jgi:hypothetical protein
MSESQPELLPDLEDDPDQGSEPEVLAAEDSKETPPDQV